MRLLIEEALQRPRGSPLVYNHGPYRRSTYLQTVQYSQLIIYVEPSQSPKPQPLGNIPFILIFSTCTLCFLFILWRRADSLRSVVSHQYVAPMNRTRIGVTDVCPMYRLKTWSRREGAV